VQGPGWVTFGGERAGSRLSTAADSQQRLIGPRADAPLLGVGSSLIEILYSAMNQHPWMTQFNGMLPVDRLIQFMSCKNHNKLNLYQWNMFMNFLVQHVGILGNFFFCQK
jgi:hypothetical protein